MTKFETFKQFLMFPFSIEAQMKYSSQYLAISSLLWQPILMFTFVLFFLYCSFYYIPHMLSTVTHIVLLPLQSDLSSCCINLSVLAANRFKCHDNTSSNSWFLLLLLTETFRVHICSRVRCSLGFQSVGLLHWTLGKWGERCWISPAAPPSAVTEGVRFGSEYWMKVSQNTGHVWILYLLYEGIFLFYV